MKREFFNYEADVQTLEQAQSFISSIKTKLDDIKSLNILPVNQLKDIENTLDSMVNKKKVLLNKQKRRFCDG